MCILRKSKKSFHTVLKKSWKTQFELFQHKAFLFLTRLWTLCEHWLSACYFCFPWFAAARGTLPPPLLLPQLLLWAWSAAEPWASSQHSRLHWHFTHSMVPQGPSQILQLCSSASGVWSPSEFAFHMHCLQILTETGQTDTQFSPEFVSEMLFAINPWDGERRVYQGRD